MADRIFVTGAGGFIGSHLVERLVREGRHVRALVSYNSRNRWGWLDSLHEGILGEIDVVTGDVRDFSCVNLAMRGCDRVAHLAALIAIPYSYRAPRSYVDTNITGTLNVVQAASDNDVSRVVHISTSEVYGSAQFVPITEDHPLQGQSPYAASKIGADQIALSFHRSFELPLTVIRPFNTYGPRQSARAIIPTIIGQLAAKKKSIKLGALSPTRDLTFIKDTARGIAMALFSDGIDGEVINLGSRFEVSIGRLAEIIMAAMGTEAEIICEPERVRPEKSEVNRLFCDNSKAERLIGWTPEFGGEDGLKRGLALTAEWMADPENLSEYKLDIYNV